ncbi:S41 family peptidase [Acidaminococcus massiliensis]|jgi:carboxyl-terminal processing protease|uniref:S41 family peptidase n=1 Tax=Acidaminococcus massiliensis TaxID=1852375 RepID=UPI00094EB027|nr:S41 family peptidase [Acidaminococcus massiliensis]
MFKKRYTAPQLLGVFFLSLGVFSGGTYYLMKNWIGDPGALFQIVRTMHLIQRHYVGETDRKKIYDGALKGMVGVLNDPYSSYLDNQDFEALSTMTEGHFGGVGMVMGLRKDNQFVVVSPIEDTPAYKAGIKAGDILLKIDGEDLSGQSLNEVVKKIRGQDGSQVTLTLKRGSEEAKDITVTRSDIKLKSVYGRMDGDGIGYIRVTNFNEDTDKDFGEKLQQLRDQGMKALVLDLRDNPGGLLESGVGVARYLVPKGPIVSVTDKDGNTQTESSSLEKVDFPLAVLVNHGTASAAEIVSGAIQDTGSGKLFGVKTYGKGVVQNIFLLSNQTAVKLTVARYYTPSGRSIDKVGITPDEVVEAAGEEGANQLQAAENYLRQQLQQ